MQPGVLTRARQAQGRQISIPGGGGSGQGVHSPCHAESHSPRAHLGTAPVPPSGCFVSPRAPLSCCCGFHREEQQNSSLQFPAHSPSPPGTFPQWWAQLLPGASAAPGAELLCRDGDAPALPGFALMKGEKLFIQAGTHQCSHMREMALVGGLFCMSGPRMRKHRGSFSRSSSFCPCSGLWQLLSSTLL